ncbi:ArsA family ATPase [Chengkuizengella sediminis]|uniref:ArsA family ATPase n=1 Tax=Chengkuizengella sediminis TaxID=1885917 RepID=UPI0013899105|nr:ArsA family ATPase [Chengkuizengella sediminis]NDI33736.1 ArsA family ATPase [Chengkuizengella sediminis]
MNQLLNKKIIFVGGKGGVGKSTSASAIAMGFAKAGKKTLLISTDPAHNTGDIFQIKINNTPTKILKNLSGIEVDSEQETKKYIKQVKMNIQEVVKVKMLEEVHRQIDTAASAPGAEEAALFDRIVSIILDEQDHYDLLIFDTAPTGHTIRLLSLPDLLEVWINGMLEKRKSTTDRYSKLLNDGEPIEDPIYEVLLKRKQRFSAVRSVLLDGTKTGIVFVLNPERLPIVETEKAILLLKQHDLQVQSLIVNKVLPEEADGQFLEQRRRIEKNYLSEIETRFSAQSKIYVPLFANDISSIDDIQKISSYIAG